MSVYGKRGILIRILYLMAAVLWYFLTLGGRLVREKAVVLCYHGIPAGHREKFRWQMEKIEGRAFFDKDTKESQCLRGNRLPRVCITFDDAFANLLDNALPILEQYQIPAIVFAVAGNLGEKPGWKMPTGHPESSERTMTADQLVSLSRHPMIRIGSHTVTHPDMTRVSKEQVQVELAESKRQLESLLDCPIEDLALPHGAYSQTILDMTQEAGYRRIYTLEPKPVNRHLFEGAIGRFSMSPDAWPVEFYLTCCGAYSWLFPFRQFVKWVGL